MLRSISRIELSCVYHEEAKVTLKDIILFQVSKDVEFPDWTYK